MLGGRGPRTSRSASCRLVSAARSSKRRSRSPPSTSRSSLAAIASSSVDLPLPFSPTKNVTSGCSSSASSLATAGSVNGNTGGSGHAKAGSRSIRRSSGSAIAEQVLTHERQAVDVVDVAVELGDDDRRRIAELGAQVLEVGGVARGKGRELVRRGLDAAREIVAQL